MGKTRDLFKKIRESKGTFNAKMGLVKDRNGMDLREEKDDNQVWQDYTEQLYINGLSDPDNPDGVVTRLDADILEFKVKVDLRRHHYEQSQWR